MDDFAQRLLGKIEEIDRLSQRIESDIGVTVVDGGELIHAIEKLDKKEWANLIKEFLLI